MEDHNHPSLLGQGYVSQRLSVSSGPFEVISFTLYAAMQTLPVCHSLYSKKSFADIDAGMAPGHWLPVEEGLKMVPQVAFAAWWAVEHCAKKAAGSGRKWLVAITPCLNFGPLVI